MTRFDVCHALVKATPMANAAYQVPPKHKTRVPSGVCCPDRGTSEASAELKDVSCRPVDMFQLRRAFPERWGEFCRRHFHDHEHLALFFDVDPRTARYWLEGKNAPAAAVVLRAVTAFPDAASCLMAGDC